MSNDPLHLEPDDESPFTRHLKKPGFKFGHEHLWHKAPVATMTPRLYAKSIGVNYDSLSEQGKTECEWHLMNRSSGNPLSPQAIHDAIASGYGLRN